MSLQPNKARPHPRLWMQIKERLRKGEIDIEDIDFQRFDYEKPRYRKKRARKAV